MGIGPFGGGRSSSRYDSSYYYTTSPHNPNPDRYKILNVYESGNNVAILIKYEGCTNYEGKKVLVYRDVKLKQLVKQGSLDPHFSNNNKFFSPIARFEPTAEGWQFAREFCNRLR